MLSGLEEALLKDDKSEVLDLLNAYYEEIGKDAIISLDHIISKHATRGLGSKLGFKFNNPNKLKKRLIELKVFSTDLKQYSKEEIEKIAEINIEKIGNTSYTSWYLTKDNPNREENRKMFAQTEQFKKYLKEKGIISLDHVISKHATNGLGSKLRFKEGNPNQLKQRLIDFEIFSTDLKQYSKEEIEEITKINIKNFKNNRFISEYLTKENPNLEENRKIFAKTEQFKKYLEEKGIISLDHITKEHTKGGLRSRLEFNSNNTNKLKQRLSEFGVLPTDLKQYSKQEVEEIVKINLEKIGNTNYMSWYLTKENPNLEENRKIFAQTEQFKKYLKEKEIISLDHITTEQATQGLGRKLGFKLKNPNKLKQRLIEMEVFSTDLKQYSKEDIEKIAEINIENIGIHSWTSWYLSKENPNLEENRKIFAQTEEFKEYLEEKEIISLDHITYKHATQGLGRKLGFKLNNPNQLKQRLIEMEVFSTDLKQYSKQSIEEIVKINIENLEKAGYSSYYLTEVNPNLEENRKIFAQTEEFKEYLEKKGIISFDHITLEHASKGLGSKLGFKLNNLNQLRQRLIEMEVFSTDLNDYSKQKVEEITEIIINKLSTRHQSTYFSNYINQEDIEQNKKTILKTQAVQKFLAQEKIDLKDSKTIKSKKAKTFFKKILGINVDENNLESKLKKIFKSSDVSYRKINTVWSNMEEHMLYDISDNYSVEEDLRDELKENKEHYQEQFGRSLFAIITKMERLGILSQQTQFGNGTKADIDKYPFPYIHRKEFNDYMIEFQNTSYLLDNNLMPNITPIFGFDSAVHEQFTHATLPIKYKGVDLVNYTLAEQELIAYTMSYISDNEQFKTKDNGDLDATQIFPHSEPRILCLQDEDQQYIQLLFRNSDNPNNQTDTEAIETDSTEVWHLKHEKALTYEETRV